MGSPDQTILTELSRSCSVRTSTPPPPSRTSTLPPSSLELELPLLESPDQELESDPFLDPSSLVMPGTHLSSSSSSLMLFWDLLCPGHGSVLFDDGILASLCFLNTKRVQMFILVV